MKVDFLFAQPSFLAGMGRVLDIAGEFDYYNLSRSEREADIKASLADWFTVGGFILLAMKAFGDPSEPASRNQEKSA